MNVILDLYIIVCDLVTRLKLFSISNHFTINAATGNVVNFLNFTDAEVYIEFLIATDMSE